MIARVLKDGQRNCSVLVKGFVTADFDPTPVLDIKRLETPREGWKGLRIDSVVWVVQEKMGLHLWWQFPEGEEDLIWTMESRNSARFDDGVPSPRVEKGWGGILHLSSFRVAEGTVPKGYMVILDLDKQ